MPETNLRFESLKLLRDWSVWLLTVEAAICGALWKADVLWGHFWALAGWTAFCLSAMVASVLLIAVPSVVRTLDAPDNPGHKRVRMLAWAECGLFLIGVLCLIVYVLNHPAPKANPNSSPDSPAPLTSQLRR